MTGYKATTDAIAGDMTALENVLGLLAGSPRECLYALINEQDKRIQIYNTTNFISHISRIAQELNALNYQLLRSDISRVKVVFLETQFDSKLQRDNKHRSLVQKYRNEGWTFYSDTNTALYKLKESYKMRDKKLYYVLELENKQGRRILVGVFRKYKDAKHFKQTNYRNEDMVTEIVVSDNNETRSW